MTQQNIPSDCRHIPRFNKDHGFIDHKKKYAVSPRHLSNYTMFYFAARMQTIQLYFQREKIKYFEYNRDKHFVFDIQSTIILMKSYFHSR